MKKVMKVVIGIVVFFALAIAAVFYFTAGMADAADSFFAAIKKQDISEARTYLSEDFKASTDEAALEEFLSNSALLKFKESNWSNRQISGGRGELDGEVITDTGGVVPLKLLFVKENDVWKIYGIQKPTAGLQTEESSPATPSTSDQAALVKRSMHDFALSVNSQNMDHFYSTISQLWKKETTPQNLNEAFGAFFDAGIDLTVLDTLQPTIEPVSPLGENGVLDLQGYYPTEPSKVTFEHQFIYEGVGWKLIGFKVNISDS